MAAAAVGAGCPSGASSWPRAWHVRWFHLCKELVHQRAPGSALCAAATGRRRVLEAEGDQEGLGVQELRLRAEEARVARVRDEGEHVGGGVVVAALVQQRHLGNAMQALVQQDGGGRWGDGARGAGAGHGIGFKQTGAS